jgi:hypothetical protein
VATNNGKKLQVYVVPGNSDINNPEACEYDHNKCGFKNQVANISKGDFQQKYLEESSGGNYFLRKDIIFNDFTNSLSYVAEPFPLKGKSPHRLWILAIDALDYTNLQHGRGKLLTKNAAGNLVNTPTMSFIENVMKLAAANNVTVLGLMHYNLVEHFNNESTSFSFDNLLENWKETLINSSV